MPNRRRKSSCATKKQKGGRKMRHTMKAKSWPQFVKSTYEAMKRKDKSATFKDAMKEASRRKKRGEF